MASGFTDIRKIRVVSDGGSPAQTRIENAETGEMLTCVRALTVRLTATDPPEVTLELLPPQIDMRLPVTAVLAPPATLRARLLAVARHLPECQSRPGGRDYCDCGWELLVENVLALLAGKREKS